MAYKVVMPKAGMAMETGKVVRWLKAEGDPVETGEPLLEIETDKVNMEVEAMNSGILLKILVNEGDEVPVVHTIGYIGEKGEALPVDEAQPVGDGSVETKSEPVHQTEVLRTVNGEGVPATPAAKRIAKEKGIDLKSVTPSGSRGQIKAADVEGIRTEVKVTPLAKAIAADKGLNLNDVTGSGFAGKVTSADVLAVSGVSSAATPATVAAGGDEFIPHTAMRKVIAKRMLGSHLEIPPVTQNCVVDVTELMALRSQINTGDVRISVNDFIIMAVTKTLKEQPRINATFTEEGLLVKKQINIGVAVALPEGLIVPVIKDADTLTLSQISQQAKTLSTKAKEGKLMPDEFSGGTFTISNLGMMGVTSFTPIINQPEIAILGVCAVEQKLEMNDEGKIEKHLKMGLSLTYDHRCIDGAQAAVFSNRVTQLLENPVMMLV